MDKQINDELMKKVAGGATPTEEAEEAKEMLKKYFTIDLEKKRSLGEHKSEEMPLPLQKYLTVKSEKEPNS